MTTQELHLSIDLLLQKVSSHWNQNFLPQEKDIFLNKEILKFIKQRINPLSNLKNLSVYDVLKRVQDLNSLVKTKELEVVTLNKKEDIVYLPFNFLYYISSSIEVTPVCIDKIKEEVNKPMYENSFSEFKEIDLITILKISIIKNSEIIEVFNLENLPEYYIPLDNIPDYKKRFILNNAIYLTLLKELEKLNIEIRYNKSLNTFELRSSNNFSIRLENNAIVTTKLSTSSLLKGNKQEKSLTAEVEIKDEEFKAKINKSSLSASTDENRVAYLRSDALIIPKSSNVVQNTINLTYICLPKKLDVLLNHNSELPDYILEEIVNNTAQTLKGIISSDTYEKYVKENTLIE